MALLIGPLVSNPFDSPFSFFFFEIFLLLFFFSFISEFLLFSLYDRKQKKRRENEI